MNEEENAQLFAEELEIARLLSSDLSRESRARARLRAELLGRARRPWSARVALWLTPALAVGAAAALLLLGAPRARPPLSPGEPLVDLAPGDRQPARPSLSLSVAQGVEQGGTRGRSVRFQLPGSAFVLETRAVSPQDLFGPPRGGVVSIE